MMAGRLNGGSRLLVSHFEEEKIRELHDVVAMTEPVISQDVAVVLELLNDAVAGH